MLETYRGSHIGQFWQGADGETHIAVYIRNGSSDKTVEADRLDPAIRGIWKEYFGSLSIWQKLVRILYSNRVWIAAIIVAVISSTIVLSADKLWGTSAQGENPIEVSDKVLTKNPLCE
ncbi:MAG: hypothetical protein OXN84_17025 [Albidovulum sp.]|nr:hypothetical protein [Albidovulum sp.]